MAPGVVQAGQKRKAESHPQTRHGSKRRKAEIPVQGQSGELNIANFVKSREFEIKALESSMQKARKGLMARAFQQLPRNMRRRTASHNVKKIPRRLRRRAEREMKEDNTPTVSKRTKTPSRKLRLRLQTAETIKKANQRSKTVRQRKKEAKANAKETDPENHAAIARAPRIKKNKLADPPKATSKYKRRQVNKTWLPTHLWHAKRAHMTRPTEPLWRMAIPLSPTEKSYRPTHRAAGSRGCIAWDTSYVSTIGCLGTEHTLQNMLKALGFLGEGGSGPKHKRWIIGSRYADGWAHAIDGAKQCLTPMSVIWIPGCRDSSPANDQSIPVVEHERGKSHRKVKLDRRIFLRVHPAAFQQFWIALLTVAKAQKPQVLVEDLRYEVGSLHIAGPASSEALAGVLIPRHEVRSGSMEEVWTSIAGSGSPASLPLRCLLSFDIVDPRLSRPPKPINVATDVESILRVNELITTWPPDVNEPAGVHLASYKHRWTASTSLPSQKAINRRKAIAGKGAEVAVVEKDPAIPVMLLAQRCGSPRSATQGAWTVLLPWACTDAVWRSLVHYPLLSGGTPRFGGLRECRQIAFEQNVPWFPGDMPGTEAGKAWERSEAEKRFDEWIRRPPSRRIAWDKLDLGLGRKGEVGVGWSCDWDYLLSQSAIKPRAISTDLQPTAETRVEISEETASTNLMSKNLQPRLAPGWHRKPRKQSQAPVEAQNAEQRRRNTSSPESGDESDSVPTEAPAPIDYCQLTAAHAAQVLKKPDDTQSKIPALATVRIRLLTKGHPTPAARIYRLPAPGAKSVAQHAQLNALVASDSLHPPKQDPKSNAGSLPMTDSSTSIFTTGTSSSSDNQSFRDKWLSHVPTEFYHNKVSLPSFNKQHHNHRGLPSKETTHAYDPPDHINVLPKNAPQSIVDEFGWKPLSSEERKQKQREALMAELMKGDFMLNGTWDASKGLVPCPNEHDLIGFATSGGYNLNEGCGTAIAGVWVQRVVEGWRANDEQWSRDTSGMEGRQKEKYVKRQEKQKHLCVVRNAGESIGRLGVWELCE